MAPIFFQTFPEKPSAAIFLSGTGTNAAKLLEGWRSGEYQGWTPRVLVTDKPETSRARVLAADASPRMRGRGWEGPLTGRLAHSLLPERYMSMRVPCSR